ncbi:MAG: STAS domain-containing protein [Methanospirillum sp.]|uniref:STAS domain-containing protein n=1 Tax=Methanospirillum sp. TaxID=45200 RepID=UPI002374051E|nr:STAS domain-containing protein [Methanospirillum sp.]MDD1728633.1 STAS domain-containing protein [Methanospirillum sp.]
MSELLEVTTRTIEGVAIVDVSGRMDAATSRDVEVALTTLIDGGSRKIVFNGKNLTYISSSGLRVVLASLKRLRQDGGEMALAALQPAPLEVIRMTGFDRIFTIFDTPELAISSISC